MEKNVANLPDRPSPACCASMGSDAASKPRTRILISPMVLSLIMASCIVTKALISQGKRLSRMPRRY